MSLRLTLLVRSYRRPGLTPVDRWAWRLTSGSREVSSSGAQLYTRRIDCARGAEVGAGIEQVVDVLAGPPTRSGPVGVAVRDGERVEVRIVDARGYA